MVITARMTLVFLVALINLGLGFAVAVHAGRGPWSRYARRLAAGHTSRGTSSPNLVKSIEQIAGELEGLEHHFQELLQRFSEGPAGQISLEEVRSNVRNMTTQVEALATDESQEYHEQAAAGLRTLLLVLNTATTELERMVENDDAASIDPVPLLTSVQMACREVSMVFNALMFAELPT